MNFGLWCPEKCFRSCVMAESRILRNNFKVVRVALNLEVGLLFFSEQNSAAHVK